VAAMLKAKDKAGKPETLLEGFQQTIQFYADNGKAANPFRVGDDLMKSTVANMVEYGGLDAVANKDPQAFYTNAYLTK
jgi:hypothetical protein